MRTKNIPKFQVILVRDYLICRVNGINYRLNPKTLKLEEYSISELNKAYGRINNTVEEVKTNGQLYELCKQAYYNTFIKQPKSNSIRVRCKVNKVELLKMLKILISSRFPVKYAILKEKDELVYSGSINGIDFWLAIENEIDIEVGIQFLRFKTASISQIFNTVIEFFSNALNEQEKILGFYFYNQKLRIQK